MRNTLEKYIQVHRNELDVWEPSPNVWAGIQSQMQVNPSFVKSHASWLKYFGFSASVIAVLVYLKVSSSVDPKVAVPEKQTVTVAQSTPPVTEPNNTLPPVEEPVEPKISTEIKAEAPVSPVSTWKALAAFKDSTQAAHTPVPAPEEENKNQTSNPTTMNSTALKTALVFSALAFDSMAIVNAQDTTDHKNTITQERPVSPFSELSISGVGDIFISQGDKEKVSITASQKDQANIEVLNEGNKLIIRQKKEGKHSCKNGGDIDIHVTLKDISKLSVSGIGKIKTETPLNLNALECNISSMGNLNLELNCKKFTADISAIGNMTLKGRADEASVELSGMGNFHAVEFEVGKLKADMSGMGNAEVYAKESLEVNASGMGNLKYKGNPAREEIKTSGMGNVKKI